MKPSRLPRLNLQAGLKAGKASAYDASWEHFRVARELLPSDAFESDYDLAFHIHLGLAKSAYIAGRCDESEALYPLLLQKARTRLDKSQVHLVQMDDYHLRGAYDRPLRCRKATCCCLGSTFPPEARNSPRPSTERFGHTPQHRGARSCPDLLAAPEIDSPEILAKLKTLWECG